MALFLTSFGALVGCDGLGETPFSLQINSINEEGPQQPAAITISDSPVFSREALINDRLREAKFITSLLEESEKSSFRDNFQPQVVRDLVNVQALVANFRAAFNPAQGASVGRTEALNELKNDIALLKLQRERTIAERNLRQAQDQAIGLDTLQSENPELGETAVSGPALPDQTKLLEQLEKAGQRAQGLLDKLEDRAGKAGARPTAVKATPLDNFRDLQAYRTELRQVLAEANLDDLHDYAGNALYRLHFLATVLPGQHKDKLGVARLTFLPPYLSEDDIAALYGEWLFHLTMRMNPILLQGRKSNSSYTQLATTGLYDVVTLDFSGFESLNIKPLDVEPPDIVQSFRFAESCPRRPSMSFAVPARDEGDLGFILKRPFLPQRISKVAAAYLRASIGRFPDEDLTSCETRVLLFVRNFLGGFSVKNTAIRFGHVPRAFTELVTINLSGKEDSELTTNRRLAVKAEHLRHGDVSVSADRPDVFIEREPTRAEVGGAGPRRIATGDAYTYATHPIEKAQRISTIARSANSLQLALSIAATVPQSGVNADLGVGYMRAAAGNAEALERAPLVVGFADRRAPLERTVKGSDPLYVSEIQAPQSGWIFGPAVRMNPKTNKLELIHSARAHRLASDVSVPGWWPRVRIVKETAWIGNWHNTNRVIRLGDEAGQGYHQEQYTIRLPRKLTDLDAFTNFIANRTIGSAVQQVQIFTVDPYYLSACTEQIDISITGANIWRSTEVRLAGIEASDVRIMPDMEGVVARFDLNMLFKTTNVAFNSLGLRRDLNLLVSTRNGTDSIPISMEGSRNPKTNTCVASSPFAPTRVSWMAQVRDVTPRRIAAGVKEQTFAIRLAGGKNLLSGEPIFLINGTVGEKQSTSASNSSDVYIVKFAGSELTPAGMKAVSLDVVAKGVITSFPIEVVEAKKQAAAPVAKLVSKEIIGTKSDKAIKFSVLMDLKGIAVSGLTRIGVALEKPLSGARTILSTAVPTALPDTADTKDRYRADFIVQKSNIDHAQLFNQFLDGKKLAFSVQQLQGTGLDPKLVAKFDTTGVFKAKAAPQSAAATDAVSIDGKKDAPDLPASVTLLFPENTEQKFPGLKSAKLVAAIKGHEKTVTLVVNPEAVKLDSNRKMTVTISVDPKSVDTFKAIRENPETNKDLPIAFSFAGVSAPNLPADFKITAKK